MFYILYDGSLFVSQAEHNILPFLGIDKLYVGVQAFIYSVFITFATSLASVSLFPGLVNIPAGRMCGHLGDSQVGDKPTRR